MKKFILPRKDQRKGGCISFKMRPDLLTLNLPAILLLGIFSSYTDIKEGKIRNRHCLWAIFYGITMLITASLIYYFTGEAINWQYYLDFAINFVIGVIISVAVWSTGLLTAGDVKLFISYSVLVPLSVYSFGYVKLFPSSTLLLNIFVPLFFFIFLYILVRTSWKEKQEAIRLSLEPKKLLFLVLAIFSLSWVISLLFKNLRFLPNDYFTMIILLFLLIYVSEKVFKMRFAVLVIALALLRLALDFGSLLKAETYESFIFLFFSMLVLRIFILELAKESFSSETTLGELKEGMILAELPAKPGEKNGKNQMYYDLLSYLQESVLNEKGEKAISRRLTNDDIEALKKGFGKRADNVKIRVHKMVPFAPFIFLGVIITIIFRGNLFSVLAVLIAKFFKIP